MEILAIPQAPTQRRERRFRGVLQNFFAHHTQRRRAVAFSNAPVRASEHLTDLSVLTQQREISGAAPEGRDVQPGGITCSYTSKYTSKRIC